MSRIAYVNGRYLPLAHAQRQRRGPRLSILRRRLRSLRGEGRPPDRRAPAHRAAAAFAVGASHRHADDAGSARRRCCARWSRRNRVRWGIVYLQITRGVARRDHAFPPPGTRPSLVVTARNLDLADAEKLAADGVAVDHGAGEPLGAGRHQIGVAAAQRAGQAGGARAGRPRGLVRRQQGFVTEGSSSNAWIVTRDGTVVTRQADNAILKGITRTVVLDVIAAQGLKLEERPFTMEEAQRRARPSSPRRARSSCRWSRSTAGRSAMARRA